MIDNNTWLQRRQAAIPRGLSLAHPLFIERAENAELFDVTGRRFIDFAGGIAVVNTGHRHPQVMDAVRLQLQRHTHLCFQVTGYDSYVELAERLNARAPGDFSKKTLLMTTGAEAVENAIKIARAYTKRPGVIAFGGAFHGRTLMALALTGKVTPYKAGFGPYPAEVYHAAFPSSLHGVSTAQSLATIEAIFKHDIEPERVAAVIFEPVQGEGGFYVAPADFVQALRALCDRHGIVLIADEIQSGSGRTGRMFAMQHYGVAADITTLAKSLGGGLPLSAIIGRADIMDTIGPGGLGGTYAGNPLACAAALAVLEVFDNEALFKRAEAIGVRLRTKFETLQRRHRDIAEVRGLGAMIALELCRNTDPQQPDAELTKALVARARELGLILLSCGSNANVIRVLVPLTASDELIDEGLEIFSRALSELRPND